jgi:hypothetical protein
MDLAKTQNVFKASNDSFLSRRSAGNFEWRNFYTQSI